MSNNIYIICIAALLFSAETSFAQSQYQARQNTQATDKLYGKFISVQAEGHNSDATTTSGKTFETYPNDYYCLKPTVSRGHINDENIITLPYNDYFTSTMSALEMKRNADIAYGMGINSVTSTMFSPAMSTYTARCNYLLQQGTPVVSYAVYMEGAWDTTGKSLEGITILPHQLPTMVHGTNFDIVTKDELEGMFSEAGELILPHVMTYRQIEGAFDPKPSAEAKARIEEMKVFLDNVTPDVDFPSDYQIVFSHRQTKTEEIYFIANISQTQYDAEFTFDSDGTSTELWDAMSAERYVLTTGYKDGMTTAKLSLKAGQSLFIVVRHYGDASNKIQTLPQGYVNIPFSISDVKPAVAVKPTVTPTVTTPAKPVVKETPSVVTAPVKPATTTTPTTPGVVPAKKQKVPTGFMKPWAIEFNMKLMHKPTATANIQNRAFYIMRPPQLTDWTSNFDTRIKFYSGVAIYRNTFNTNDVPNEGNPSGNHYTLKIEEAHDTVTVIVNGVEVRQLTAAPYVLDITQYVCQGSNAIELHVKNSPVNRLVGDLTLPEELRINKTIPSNITLDTPLQPSGIVGLVKVLRE